MVVLSSLVVVVAWKIAGLFFENQTGRALAVAACTIALPLLLAGNQVYTEVPAGLLCLTSLYWLLTIGRGRKLILEMGFATVLAFLPWLQIKLIGATAILAIAIFIKMIVERRPWGRIAILSSICGLSGILLAAYNLYAFGRLLGPYTGGEFELSKTSLMVFVGLLIDQNHGFLLQNPIQLIGVFAFASFFAYNPFVAVTWLVLFVDLLVPNATYTNGWYGAWSFVGRYEWTAAIVAFVPTLFGLAGLWLRRRWFYSLVAADFVIQAHAYVNYTFRPVTLLNKWGTNTPFPLPPPGDFSPFYGRLESILPVLGNTAWAYSYLPNYIFGAAVLVVFLLGFRFAPAHVPTHAS